MQKWSCPTGEQWERYLLEDGTAERNELELHLQNCPHCRFLLAQRKRELENLQAVWNEPAEQDVIRLHPLMLDTTFEGYAAVLLAAKGDKESTEAEAITLASSDHKVILRAVRDPHSREVCLYLLSDDPTICSNALVKPFKAEQEFLTDNEGRVNLGVIDWPEPKALTAEVRLPKATFALSLLEDFGEKEKSVELTSPRGDRVKVTFSGEGRNRRLEINILDITDLQGEKLLKVAVRGAGEAKFTLLRSIVSNRATFDDVDILGAVEIYLYH